MELRVERAGCVQVFSEFVGHLDFGGGDSDLCSAAKVGDFGEELGAGNLPQFFSLLGEGRIIRGEEHEDHVGRLVDLLFYQLVEEGLEPAHPLRGPLGRQVRLRPLFVQMRKL